ncbi:hypothetical protein [Croceicoccus gelatinilyticus]|uniref:hypothetical protein n=1 Tax=Croceicoccus gelatinilyticus TaxID=2835536 RepID=UPI001BCD37AD|nr:hypothetical protein [Croceicoccus gelatinilyticus]MBS7671362.1 hypothetical protein [Croceicoccus gelatinilyticus]
MNNLTRVPARVVTTILRTAEDGSTYTIARASTPVADGETSSQVARSMRHSTIRDLQRASGFSANEGLLDGLGKHIEDETRFNISELEAGRPNAQVAATPAGQAVPGMRFSWPNEGETATFYIEVKVLSRADTLKTDALLQGMGFEKSAA